eukprot:s709_g14.t1
MSQGDDNHEGMGCVGPCLAAVVMPTHDTFVEVTLLASSSNHAAGTMLLQTMQIFGIAWQIEQSLRSVEGFETGAQQAFQGRSIRAV